MTMSDDPRAANDPFIPRNEDSKGPCKQVACPLCGEEFGNMPNHLRTCAATDQ